LGGLVALCATGIWAQAQEIPDWWIARGIVNTNVVENDFGVANLGQIKQVALQTWIEVTNRLSQVSTNETDPTVPANLKDGIDWSELIGIPADISDGDDVGSGGSGDAHSLDSVDGSIVDALYVNESGQVGIGTTIPSGEFHVEKPNQITPVTFAGSGPNDLNMDASGYTGLGDIRYIVKVENSGPNPNWFKYSNDGGITWTHYQEMTQSGFDVGHGVTIGFGSLTGHTYDDSWEWTVSAGTPNNLVVKNGKVGVGIADPSSALDVRGVVTATAFLGDGSGLTNLSVGVSLENDPEVGTNTLNVLPRWDGNALVAGSIYDDGNVGIGTITPKAAFHVNGTVRFDQGVYVSSSGDLVMGTFTNGPSY